MYIEVTNTTRNCYHFKITKEDWNEHLAYENSWYQRYKDTGEIASITLNEVKERLDILNKYSFEEINEICQESTEHPTDANNKVYFAVVRFLDDHFMVNYVYEEEDLVDSYVLEEDAGYGWDTDEE